MIFSSWQRLHTQHDAGEFLLHLLAIAKPGACQWRWEAKLTNPYRVHDSGDPGCPLLLTLPGESLQGLLDAWHNQYTVHALTQHTGCLFLQICRYSSHTAKNQQRLAVRPGAVVALPVFTEDGDACTRLEPFRVIAVVFHLGPTVTSGHYQTLLGMPTANDWTLYVCDDNRKPRKANTKDLALVDHNAYLVGFCDALNDRPGQQGAPTFQNTPAILKQSPAEALHDCCQSKQAAFSCVIRVLCCVSCCSSHGFLDIRSTYALSQSSAAGTEAAAALASSWLKRERWPRSAYCYPCEVHGLIARVSVPCSCVGETLLRALFTAMRGPAQLLQVPAWLPRSASGP